MDSISLQKLGSDLRKIVSVIDDNLKTQKNETKIPKQWKAGNENMTKSKNKASMESTRVRTNLARAIQWYSPDMISTLASNETLAELECLLNCEQKKKKSNNQLHRQQRFEQLLVDIKSANYTTLERFLQLIAKNNPGTVKQIRKLYKQYNETDFDSSLCNYCKIRKSLDIRHLNRFLWRYDIISAQLFKKIVISDADKVSQDLLESLWQDLEKELENYDAPKFIVIAISDALENNSDVAAYKELKFEVRDWLWNSKSKFTCECKELRFLLCMPATDMESETDIVTSDYDDENNCNRMERKRYSRSTSSTRRRKRQNSEPHEKLCKSLAVPKKSLALQQTNINAPFSTSMSEKASPINVGKKKTTKIFNFTNNQGPVSVGNRYVRVGKHQLSDTSNDTDDYSTNVSDSDYCKSLSAIKGAGESSILTRSSRVDAKYSRELERRSVELKEMEPSRWNRTNENTFLCTSISDLLPKSMSLNSNKLERQLSTALKDNNSEIFDGKIDSQTYAKEKHAALCEDHTSQPSDSCSDYETADSDTEAQNETAIKKTNSTILETKQLPQSSTTLVNDLGVIDIDGKATDNFPSRKRSSSASKHTGEQTTDELEDETAKPHDQNMKQIPKVSGTIKVEAVPTLSHSNINDSNETKLKDDNLLESSVSDSEDKISVIQLEMCIHESYELLFKDDHFA